MKKAIAILLAAFLVFSLAGCANEGTDKPADPPSQQVDAPPANAGQQAEVDQPVDSKKTSDWVLAYLCKDLSQQWFIDESGQMLKIAKELGAKDVIMCDSGMNPEKYMTDLDAMISQKVDLIFVCPPDQQLSQVTVDRCAAAGIPVIAIDDALIDENGNVLAPVVELSAFNVGRQQGEWLGDYYQENYASLNAGEVGYMVMTMNEVSSCVPRHLGAQEAFGEKAGSFNYDNMIEANYDGTPEKGFEVAAATITANPHIKYWMVTAPNDEGAMGATRALEQAGVDKDSVVVGCGAYHAKDEFKKDYSAMKAAVYFDARVAGETVTREAMGYLKDGIEMCKDFMVAGQNFGRRPFGGVLVTIANYKEIMGEAAD